MYSNTKLLMLLEKDKKNYGFTYINAHITSLWNIIQKQNHIDTYIHIPSRLIYGMHLAAAIPIQPYISTVSSH